MIYRYLGLTSSKRIVLSLASLIGAVNIASNTGDRIARCRGDVANVSFTDDPGLTTIVIILSLAMVSRDVGVMLSNYYRCNLNVTPLAVFCNKSTVLIC